MEITSFVGDQLITASSVTVRVNSADRERALALAHFAKAVPAINNEEDFTEVRRIASQLKSMLDDIELSRKQAKQPFASVGTAIDDLARDVAQPVKTQQTRILGLLAGYVAKLEAAKREEERLAAEAKRLAQEEADRRVREAEAARAKAEADLRAATDEIERAKLREAGLRQAAKLTQLQLEAELADEDILSAADRQMGLVPDGRVNHVYDFQLVNVQQTCDARCFRLLRWELDIRACQDSVKSQLELAPDVEPSLPGITITKRLSVSVKAASRISR